MSAAGTNVGFIGGGNMSSIIGTAIIEKGIYDPKNVWVSGPHIENLKHWSNLGAMVTNKNGLVYDNCDLIFLGVKPNVLTKSIDDIIKTKNTQDKNVVFVSMLAGTSITKTKNEVKRITNDAKVVRIMPNTPMLTGSGCCLLTPDTDVTVDELKPIESIINACGMCERIDEKVMDGLAALTGCGPAFMYTIAEGLADGAVKMGAAREQAKRLTAQMMLGSALMMLKVDKHPAQLRDEVCSPGGTTICGVAALERGAIRCTLMNAIEDATKRAKELENN